MPVRTDGQGNAPTALITVAQALTGAWKDLGPEIDTWGKMYFVLYPEVLIGDSLNVRFRFLFKTVSAGPLEYTPMIETISSTDIKMKPEYFELDTDASQNPPIQYQLFGYVPYVQVQVMAETAGASPGQITSCLYAMWGQ